MTWKSPFDGKEMRHPSLISGAHEAFWWAGELVASAEIAITDERQGQLKRTLKILFDEIESARRNLGPDEVQVSFYECEFCKYRTPKRHWGPGWMRCPNCKKQALTIAEKQNSK